jgi:hypothetical protein
MLVKQQLDVGDFLKALNESAENTGKTVRGYTALWIDSGILPNGVEEPKSRILPEFARESIRNLTGTPLSIHIRPDGAVRGLFSFAPQLPNPIGPQELIDLDDRYGVYSFLLFLDCGDLRFRLARCQHDGCAAPYFWRKRVRLTYKRGALCPHHMRQAAGNRARKVERNKLLGLAAKFWPQWTPAKHPSRALWISGQVNARRIGAEVCITQKWVSRNHVAIQVMATKNGKQ